MGGANCERRRISALYIVCTTSIGSVSKASDGAAPVRSRRLGTRTNQSKTTDGEIEEIIGRDMFRWWASLGVKKTKSRCDILGERMGERVGDLGESGRLG